MDKILYSAVILTAESRDRLLKTFGWMIPINYKVIAHHMTIVFGKGLDDKNELGKEVELTVTELGISDMAMAVKVEGYPSANAIPHITIAVNEAGGGKPVQSNQIENWKPLDINLKISGIITEIKG